MAYTSVIPVRRLDRAVEVCTEQRTGRAVCVGVESRQPALFACVYGDLRGSAYRGCVGSEEYPPRRGAWLGGLGRCVSAE